MKDLVLGIDGGGTKTLLSAMNLHGEELFRMQGSSININGIPPETAKRNLISLLQEAVAQAPSVQRPKAVCLGVAGISNPCTEEVLRAAISEVLECTAVSFVGDHITALAGALGGKPGLLLISGTGSICVGRDSGGNTVRVGGMGHLVDDEGSGYAIGRDILRAIIRGLDGRGPQTSLTQAVFEKLHIQTIEELIAFIYLPGRPKKDIADLARLLPLHCSLGDDAACKISKKAVDELVLLSLTTASRLNLHCGDLAIAGSVLQKNSYLQASFREAAAQTLPGFRVVFPRYDAAYGAALVALQRITR